ncbi:methylated-DNA-[protein]-cysteine S-methyltransferase [Anaerovirgula multivorans]|uniref:Methylated-DNA--protein-cysteine methyltransferase n=1 Tax=Anaerovirgula multivorans TaxID=312168 RepID=A0A239H5X8_9FIRM|nr:methylated-DNA--[protein]-cysteine S-methyltransferase [Anaerovirgula multivorans]SNS76555.1 methylated-DNA-[protein]-cysteine S-methyltransferase [Anaerovirgula multivorans]
MLDIYYCSINIGGYDLHLASSEKGLVAIGIEEIEEQFIKDLKKDFSERSIILNEAANLPYIQQLTEFFQGNRKTFTAPLHLIGTKFQKQVWQALLKIPFGKVVSYKDIAVEIGNPKAMRAVGMANNKNRIPIIIPCHRVIGSNKKLVGYGGGLHIKERLLKLEGIEIVKEKVVN